MIVKYLILAILRKLTAKGAAKVANHVAREREASRAAAQCVLDVTREVSNG